MLLHTFNMRVRKCSKIFYYRAVPKASRLSLRCAVADGHYGESSAEGYWWVRDYSLTRTATRYLEEQMSSWW